MGLESVFVFMLSIKDILNSTGFIHGAQVVIQKLFLFFIAFFLISHVFASERVVNLVVAYKTVNFAGKPRKAIAVNNQIPAPTLHFNEGDHVTINVYNQLDQETAVHWHGILLPWQMDGVLGVTQHGIKPGDVFHYQFTLRQSGTYWYHAHAGLQEQQGLYGAFIIDPAQHPDYQYTKDYVIVLSDWSNTYPDQILRNLKKEGDYYSPRFPLQPSLEKFMHDYHNASTIERKYLVADYKLMQQMRMSIYDISDVAYDAFLLNGHAKSSPWRGLVKISDIVRLRFIGAGGSTLFHVKMPNTSMQIVQVDGNDIKPYSINDFIIAPGETYDILVKIQKNAPYIIYAESIDTVGAAYGALITSSNQFVNYKNVKPFSEPLPVTREMMSMMMGEIIHGSIPITVHEKKLVHLRSMDMKNGMSIVSDSNKHSIHEIKSDSMNMDHQVINHSLHEEDADSTDIDNQVNNHSSYEEKSDSTKMDPNMNMHHQVNDHSRHEQTPDSMKMDTEMKMDDKANTLSNHQSITDQMKTDSHIKMYNRMSADHSMDMSMPTEPSIIEDTLSSPPSSYKTSAGTKYQNMTAAIKTNDPNKAVFKVINMELFGYMDHFIWFINGVPEHQAKPIVLEPGKRYRIIFTNTSMMHHPMHIHGHWFILREGKGAYDPLLHTIDVPPGATITADIDTDASGQWIFHCHLLYHMMSGMSRIFQYSTLIEIINYKIKPENIVEKTSYYNRPIVKVDEVRPIDTMLVKHPMPHPINLWFSTFLDAGIDPFHNTEKLTYKGLYGLDYNKLELFVNDAEVNKGNVEDADIDIFYWHLLDQFWAVKGGINYTYRPADTPYWQPGISIEGLMPYFIDTDVRGYYHSGSAKIDVELSRDTQITNNMFVRMGVRSIVASQTVTQAEIGSGLNQMRYILRPYYRLMPGLSIFAEYEHEQDYGSFKNLQNNAGESTLQNTVTFGLSVLF
jgi:CopA family copper-resistance protein